MPHLFLLANVEAEPIEPGSPRNDSHWIGLGRRNGSRSSAAAVKATSWASRPRRKNEARSMRITSPNHTHDEKKAPTAPPQRTAMYRLVWLSLIPELSTPAITTEYAARLHCRV